MKANAVPLLALFEKKMRLEVPLFQRQYVWQRDEQWEPLWEDISRKFNEYLEGRKDTPVHFLGAMVLDLKQTPATHVEKRQVIDGQQRLTTFQIFLAALRDFCRAEGCEELARELDGFTLNKGMMADPSVDKFKVWPTQADRDQFSEVISLGSPQAVEAKHPPVKKKHTRLLEPRPRMVESYLYFSEVIRDFFFGTEQEPAAVATVPLAARLEECFQALKSALQVVVIDLEQGDDAQVIFETLNARGQPLLPADLLRNYIFLRAGRNGEPQEDLYTKHWTGFEDEFWSKETRQGRLNRPRSDLFMQHFLVSRRAVDVPVKHLFVEYRHWIEREKPFQTVDAELASLASHREMFRRLHQPTKGDIVHPLARFLLDFDIGTVHSFLLFLFDKGINNAGWRAVSRTIESYLLRRAMLSLSTKSYTRIFIQLMKNLRLTSAGSLPGELATALSALQGDSSRWPTDAEFSEAWKSRSAYTVLDNAKITHVFRRLNDTFLTKLNEPLSYDGPLTVEHIMPQSWVDEWPLPSGEPGLTAEELANADQTDLQVMATRDRNALVQTWGNLTILTQGLNSTVSNSGWKVKKPEILNSSLLPINQQLHIYPEWNEETIRARGADLLSRALTIWPAPVS
jgi:hypothetical protein